LLEELDGGMGVELLEEEEELEDGAGAERV
jgi:hypothetical protein